MRYIGGDIYCIEITASDQIFYFLYIIFRLYDNQYNAYRNAAIKVVCCHVNRYLKVVVG